MLEHTFVPAAFAHATAALYRETAGLAAFGLDGYELVSLLDLATGAFALASTLLGVGISYMAYRGLRRHDSEPMRYLAVGMMLLFGVTYALALLGQTLVATSVVPLYFQDFFRLVVRVLQFAGLACITYSLWLGARTNDPSTTTESSAD